MNGSSVTPIDPRAEHLDELTALYETRIGDVYSFVYRRCGGSVGLTEDITQETFLAAARRFNEQGQIVGIGWLYEVARRRLIDHWRTTARKERRLRILAGGHSTELTTDFTDSVVSSERLLEALATIPDSQRAALVLRYLDGYTTKQVAELLGRSLKATESVLARARQNVISQYREQDYG